VEDEGGVGAGKLAGRHGDLQNRRRRSAAGVPDVLGDETKVEAQEAGGC
jgi:hypothetical protein